MNNTSRKFLDYLCVGGAFFFITALTLYFLYGNYVIFFAWSNTGQDLLAAIVAFVIWFFGLFFMGFAIVVNFSSSLKRVKEYRHEKRKAKFPDHEFGDGNKPKKTNHKPTTF